MRPRDPDSGSTDTVGEAVGTARISRARAWSSLRWTGLAAAVLVIAAGAAWFVTRPAVMEVATVARGDAAEIVYATGTVEPRVWAKVTSTLRERIVDICRCEGETVQAGDVLVRLDDSQARATLAEMEARRGLARREVDRLTSLAAREVASRQALDRAESELVQAEALVAGQRARLESYLLRAPARGTVLRRDGEVGEIAEPGTVLAWVGQPMPLLVVAEVNEEDIPRVAVGQKVLLKADAFPDREVTATVDSITPKGDPQNKTYRVRLALPDDTPVRIGMTVEANIVVRVSRAALLTPTAALSGQTVITVEEGRARHRAVETGIRGNAQAEIISGLSEGSLVVVPFAAGLADGARVDARPVEPIP